MASTSSSLRDDRNTNSGTPPEMDKLLPNLPKEAVADSTENTPRGHRSVESPDTRSAEEQREPFCSPAPPPFPFSLSYSSKSESSGERAPTTRKKTSTEDDRRDTHRSRMVAVNTPPGASPTSSSAPPSASPSTKEKETRKNDTIAAAAAKHPGEQFNDACMENHGKVKSPTDDPMYTSLFATAKVDSKKDDNTSNGQEYASPNPNQLHVGKVVTEEEASPIGAAGAVPQLSRYENHAETPSRGDHTASYYHHASPNGSYPYPPGHYYQPGPGHGPDDIYQGYPSYPYHDSRPRDESIYASYPYYHDHASGYNYGSFPGDGYVGNHAEQAYYHPQQQEAGGVNHSPGQVSYQSHSPGTYQSPNHHVTSSHHHRNDSGQESPYKPMPLISSGSSPPFKKQRSTNNAWSERFSELVEYKKDHGDCNVPQKYPENASLGIWVNKQRMEYKLFQEGKKSSMSLERIQKLESAGFTWAKRKGPEAWETKFKELVLYKEEHGDCLVPTKYTKNKALGRWVSTQRAQYKLWEDGKKSTLTDERKDRLEDIGFVWRLQF